jgi:hypothetical protein
MTTGLKNKVELLLALLYAGEHEEATPIEGITRLEKMLFLLKIEEGFLSQSETQDTFNFVPFRMGPWSSEVYDEVDFLESLGLLEKESNLKQSPADAAHDDELFNDLVLDKYQKQSSVNLDENAEIFRLTEKGKKKAKEVWSKLSVEEKNKIISIKYKYNTMNLKQFLRYVYKQHPEYTTASEIKDYLGIKES